MINTERLHIRPFVLDDAPFILDLLNSPGWLEYIGDRNVHTTQDATAYLKDRLIASYQEHGFGFYCVEQLSDQAPIGMCGLAQRPYLHEPDLGFALLPDYAGKGYALEASVGVLQYALNVLHIRKLTAFTLPSNERSIRLLEKVGFHHAGPFSIPGDEEELLLLRNFRASKS